MKLDILKTDGAKAGTLDVNVDIFDGTVKETLFHEVVNMQLANRRAGTASTKTRSEVKGSGAKPWRQKGTGRARAGRKSSPIWRSGGVVFGPRPRDYSYKVPKKVAKAALRSAIQLRLNEGMVKVLDAIKIDEPKTKYVLEVFLKMGCVGALLVIDGSEGGADAAEKAKLTLATRNLQNYNIIDVAGLNVYDVLRHKELLITKGAYGKLETMVGAKG